VLRVRIVGSIGVGVINWVIDCGLRCCVLRWIVGRVGVLRCRCDWEDGDEMGSGFLRRFGLAFGFGNGSTSGKAFSHFKQNVYGARDEHSGLKTDWYKG
jgi:hypothetical protein